MRRWSVELSNILVVVLSGVLLWAYLFQVFEHEQPCPLCMLQRLAMIGVGTGALMNLKFGFKAKHYAISLLSAMVGASISLRQISLHICPGFPTFGTPVFGLNLYSWAFLVFASSLFVISLLLFLYNPAFETPPKRLGFFSKLAFVFLFVIALANVVTTFLQCSFGPCQG